MERDLLPKAIVVVVVVVASLAFAVGATVESPGPSAASQPLSIVSFVSNGKAPPLLNLTMQSTAKGPIENLTVQLLLSCQACGFAWGKMYLESPANITAVSPLLPGQFVSFVLMLGTSAYGAACSSNELTITGSYGDIETEASPFAMVTSTNLTCPPPPS